VSSGDRAFFPLRSVLPTSLTLLRLGLAIALPFLDPNLWWRVFLIAVATEFLDGFLARMLRAKSEFGRIADPIADKAFVFTLVVLLVVHGRLPLLHLLAIGLRDEIVLLGSLTILAFGNRSELLRLKPSWVGKTATVFQFLYLGWILRAGTPPSWMLALTALTSLLAGLDYVIRYRKQLAEPTG